MSLTIAALYASVHSVFKLLRSDPYYQTQKNHGSEHWYGICHRILNFYLHRLSPSLMPSSSSPSRKPSRQLSSDPCSANCCIPTNLVACFLCCICAEDEWTPLLPPHPYCHSHHHCYCHHNTIVFFFIILFSFSLL